MMKGFFKANKIGFNNFLNFFKKVYKDNGDI